MKHVVVKTKKIKGSVEKDSLCYRMFSTVIGTYQGTEIVVMSQKKEELQRYLSRVGCGSFNQDNFQDVVVFSAKRFIESGSEE